MNIALDFLDWDSKFFKKRIFRSFISNASELTLISNELKRKDADLCYVFANEDLKIDHDQFFFLADKKVTFHKKIERSEPSPVSERIASTLEFNEQLLGLAILSGHKSRFKLDKELSPKFDQMYTIWLDRSLKRQIASEVFVYKEDNSVLGFVSIAKKDEIGVIGLIAVEEHNQGKKIGSQLMNRAEQWCVENNLGVLEVATQLDNVQACEFYRRNGYVIKQTEYIYHFYNKL